MKHKIGELIYIPIGKRGLGMITKARMNGIEEEYHVTFPNDLTDPEADKWYEEKLIRGFKEELEYTKSRKDRNW